jgi:hypothetical protein
MIRRRTIVEADDGAIDDGRVGRLARAPEIELGIDRLSAGAGVRLTEEAACLIPAVDLPPRPIA